MNNNLMQPSGPISTSRKERIDQERIHLIHKQSPMGLAASIILAAVLVYLLRNTIAPIVLYQWYGAIILVSVLRIILIVKYPGGAITIHQSLRWRRWNNITLALSGSIWGAAAWWLFPVQSDVHQFFLVLAVCGMVAGSAMAFAVMEQAFFCFSLPALLPLFLRLITLPGEVHLSMGIIAVLFWVLSYMIVANYKRARMKLINLKEDLSDLVAERTLRLEKLNTRLRAENRHRLRMEERLRQERDRLETITGNLSAGIAVISKDYKIIWSNQVMKKIFGEVEGRSCLETICRHIDRSQCNAVKVLEQNWEKATREQETRDAANTPVWFQMIATPIRNGEGQVTAALELVLPITDLKMAQEEKQRMATQLEEARKLEAVATLAGGMAHKFNNALAVIMGNAELIRFDLDRPDAIERCLQPIVSAATQMSHLTDQLLAYAKGGKYKAKPNDMAAFIDDTIALLKHTLPLEINIITQLEKTLPYVKMDLTQMQMVLSAIVSNAVEALPGKGNIHIQCRNQTIQAGCAGFGNLPPGPYVALTITDDGIGMEEKTLQRIFEPFFSTKFEGRGLGMAAVYGIIQNHGGHVAISSKPNEGTQVTIFMPATPSPEIPGHSAAPNRPPGHFTVLLIEDEHLVRQVNQTILTRLGYRVITAVDGHEALRKIRDPRLQFDLILLDIKLPDMDGLAIYPIAKAQRPAAKVIICSGYALDGPTQALMDVGADGFIQKPFSIESLAGKMNDVLSPNGTGNENEN